MRAAPDPRRHDDPAGRNDSAADLHMMRLQALQQDAGSGHRSDLCRNAVFSNRFIGFAEFLGGTPLSRNGVQAAPLQIQSFSVLFDILETDIDVPLGAVEVGSIVKHCKQGHLDDGILLGRAQFAIIAGLPGLDDLVGQKDFDRETRNAIRGHAEDMLEAGFAGLLQLAVPLVEILVDIAGVRRIGLFAADGPCASQGRLVVFLEQPA